jgi:hypothetical protein
MTAWRRAVELALESEDVARLTSIARSRTEPASRVERARMLLAYRENPSFFAVVCAADSHGRRVRNEQLAVWISCANDDGGPIGIGFQEQVPNQSKLLHSKGVVVSVGSKARRIFGQVCI